MRIAAIHNDVHRTTLYVALPKEFVVPASTLVIVFGSWLLLLGLTVLWSVSTRGGDE